MAKELNKEQLEVRLAAVRAQAGKLNDELEKWMSCEDFADSSVELITGITADKTQVSLQVGYIPFKKLRKIINNMLTYRLQLLADEEQSILATLNK